MKRLLPIILMFLLLPLSLAEPTEEFDKDIKIEFITGNIPMATVDFNSDGVVDGAVALHLDGSRALAYSFAGPSFIWSASISRGQSEGAITSADLDGDGYRSDVVVGADELMAVNKDGRTLWSFKPPSSVFSVTTADLNGDGKSNEVVLGGFEKVHALDSKGRSIWNFTATKGGVVSLASIDRDKDGSPESVAFANGELVYLLSKDGSVVWNRYFSGGSVQRVIAADTDGDGYLSDVVVGVKEGNFANVTVLDSSGIVKWDYKGYLGTNKIELAAIDLDSSGKRNYIILKADSIHALTPVGTRRWLYTTSALSIHGVDFNSDGMVEGVAVGTADKILALNSLGQQAGYYVKDKEVAYNQTGAKTLNSADLDGDGYVDDLMGASETAIFAIPHKSLVQAPTAKDTDGDGLTDAVEIQLGTDSKKPDTDGDGLTDQQEVTLETNPIKSDSDGDGYIDSLDPNPLDPRVPIGTSPPPVTTTAPPTTPAQTTPAPTVTTPPVITQPPTLDTDGDGLTDEQEKILKTNPYNADTDSDGLVDSVDPNPLVSERQPTSPLRYFLFGVLIVLLVFGVVAFYLFKKQGQEEWSK